MNFVFLNNDEHPIGRLILKELIELGMKPSLIVQETSSYATQKRTACEKCVTRAPLPPLVESMADYFDIPHLKVSNLNDKKSEQIIAEARPDIVALGNCRIIKKNILAIPRFGIINVHQGVLPEVRGALPQCWSIIEDKPLGCTSHFIDESIDTGPIIEREMLKVQAGETLENIVEKTLFLSAKLMRQAFTRFSEGNFASEAQPSGDYPTYSWPSDATIARAKTILAFKDYSHYDNEEIDFTRFRTPEKQTSPSTRPPLALVSNKAFARN